jgi:glutamate-1-semialdehyde 2,1-aminomutase
VAALFHAYPHQIAAVIVEPVAGNMGCVPPRPGFLHGLRDLCDEHGALLIFDEVMTGFRLGLGGAQTLFRITPDLTTLGKVLGGGLPVGAYGGRRDLMELVAPRGPVYQAGTLSGNPLGMAAGLATLEWLRDHPQIYLELEKRVTGLAQSVRRRVAEKGWPVTVQSLGSMITVFFTEEEVRCWDEANRCDRQKFGEFFHALLRRGIHLPPSQFESWFLSAALGEDEWLFLEGAILKSLEEVLRTTS